MRYEGRIFRPPSEARSLIVQATVGCSHNECAFCDMYKEKSFHIRPIGDVLEDFDLARARYSAIDKIFIADGDALVRRTSEWEAMLYRISELFPECRSVTTYASPKSIMTKTDDELAMLHSLGLDMAYLGLESGSDEVLALMRKGETCDGIVECARRVKRAGIRLSVTAISGLGGQRLWREHAERTGHALTRMKPDFIGLLTLMLEGGAPIVDWVRDGSFELLKPLQVMEEAKLLLENLDADGAVFRSNHPSNYLTLKGTLNADRDRLIKQVDAAIRGEAALRGEGFRAL